MSLFITNDNQTLLWNVINNTELFKQVFYPGSPYSPTIWFRNIIQNYYAESLNVTKNELNIFNKQVISFMLENLQQRVTTSTPIQYTATQEQNKSELYQSQFEQRQHEYTHLLKKPEPPKVNFINSIKDEVISNMDELLLEQKKIREQEILQNAPTSSNSNSNSNEDYNELNMRMQILESKLTEILEVMQPKSAKIMIDVATSSSL